MVLLICRAVSFLPCCAASLRLLQQRRKLTDYFRVFLKLNKELLQVKRSILLLLSLCGYALLNLSHIRIGVESRLKALGVDFAILVKNVRVEVRDHIRLGVAGITLSSFDVSVVELQLVGGTGSALYASGSSLNTMP